MWAAAEHSLTGSSAPPCGVRSILLNLQGLRKPLDGGLGHALAYPGWSFGPGPCSPHRPAGRNL